MEIIKRIVNAKLDAAPAWPRMHAIADVAMPADEVWLVAVGVIFQWDTCFQNFTRGSPAGHPVFEWRADRCRLQEDYRYRYFI